VQISQKMGIEAATVSLSALMGDFLIKKNLIF